MPVPTTPPTAFTEDFLRRAVELLVTETWTVRRAAPPARPRPITTPAGTDRPVDGSERGCRYASAEYQQTVALAGAAERAVFDQGERFYDRER